MKANVHLRDPGKAQNLYSQTVNNRTESLMNWQKHDHNFDFAPEIIRNWMLTICELRTEWRTEKKTEIFTNDSWMVFRFENVVIKRLIY